MAKHSVIERQTGVSRTRNDLVDQSLYRIAAILLRIGMDAPAAEKLLRKAFILAARDTAANSARRPTQSQIASVAGVSRREVRLAKRRQKNADDSEANPASTRIQEVVNGWCTDSRFIDRRGKPRPLSLKPRRNGFDQLVKSYGRDVTIKTLKVQMIEKGLVKEDGGLLTLLSSSVTKKKGAGDADLQYLASQLKAIDFQLGRRAYLTKRVSIFATDKKSALRIRGLITQRLEPLLNSIASISSTPTGKRPRKQDLKFRILVSAAIATEEGVHNDHQEIEKSTRPRFE